MTTPAINTSLVCWTIEPSEASDKDLYLWCDATRVFATNYGSTQATREARLIYYDLGRQGLRVDLDPRDVREQLETPKGQRLLDAVSTNFHRMSYALASEPEACNRQHWTTWKMRLEDAVVSFRLWFAKVLTTLDRYSSAEFIYGLTERVKEAWSSGVSMAALRNELVVEEAEHGRRLYIGDVEAVLESMYASLDVRELRKGKF